MAKAIASDARLSTPRNLQIFTLTNGLHSPEQGGRPGDITAALQSAQRVNEPTIFIFFDLHPEFGGDGRAPNPRVIRALKDLAHEFRTGPTQNTMLIVAPNNNLPADLSNNITVLELPLPGTSEIDAILGGLIEANSQAVDVQLSDDDRRQLIEAAQGLSYEEAENAFARAIVNDRTLSIDDVSLVLREKRQIIKKSGILEFIESNLDMNNVGGLENLKVWLEKRKGTWLPEAREWGLASPKGVLITGVPGCGKSLTAKCSAAMWGLPLLRLDMGSVYSGLVGSSEKNLRDSLTLAEAVSPSILWIDEIEKGFGSPGGGDSGTSQRIFGTFLTWLQEKASPVFVIATANRIDSLPPELLRKGRFDEVFFVDLPTQAERKNIWEIQLTSRIGPSKHLAGGFDLGDKNLLTRLASASDGFSGAEIAECVNGAAFDAYANRQQMKESDIERAIENTVPISRVQAQQIDNLREWASTRAVSATIQADVSSVDYQDIETLSPYPAPPSPRGGRRVEF